MLSNQSKHRNHQRMKFIFYKTFLFFFTQTISISQCTSQLGSENNDKELIEPLTKHGDVLFKALSFLTPWNMGTWNADRRRVREKNNNKVYDIAKFIIDSGINPNIASDTGKLVVMEVIVNEGGYNDMVKYLIDVGVDVNATSDYYQNRTAIIEAVTWGDIELVKILLEAGADITFTGNEKPLVFVAADHLQSSEKLKLLVDHGSDVNVTWNGKSLLNEAIKNRDEKLFKLLIELGANSKPVTNTEFFIEQIYALSKKPAIAKGLLDIGFNTNVRSSEGKTALIESIPSHDLGSQTTLIGNKVKLIKYLLEAGADPNLASQEGKIPLFEAIQEKNVETVKALIEAGADLNAIGNYYNEETPLIKAITVQYGSGDQNKLKIVRALVEAGSDLNATFGGESILLNAVKADRRSDIFTLLVEAGAKINVTDTDALYEAVSKISRRDKDFSILKYLIGNRADVNKKTEGVSILYRAVESENVNLIEYLVSEGASINEKSENPASPKKLYYKSENANADESFPIIYAAVSKQQDIVKVLVENGADVEVSDSNGKTAIDYILKDMEKDGYYCRDCSGIKNLLQDG